MTRSLITRLAATALALLAAPALAQTASTLSVKDGLGTAQSLATYVIGGRTHYGIVVVDGSGNPVVPLAAGGTVNIGNTVGVSAASLPLPAGAATDSSFSTANGYLAQIAAAAADTTTPQPVSGNIAVSSLPSTPAGQASIGGVTLNVLANANGSAGLFSSAAFVSAASTNGTLIKSSGGRLIGGMLANTSTGFRYVHFYNNASAPTPGTTTRFFVVALPPGSEVPISEVVSLYGAYFSSGIGIGITGGAASTDATAVAAGDVVVSLLYL